MQVELRSNTMEHGEQFVIISGMSVLQMLSAECLVLLGHPMLGIILTLEEAVDQYGWMKCSVLEVKTPYMNVPIATGVYIIVNTMKMLV